MEVVRVEAIAPALMPNDQVIENIDGIAMRR